MSSSPSAKIHPLYLRVDPADIAYVKFLFESYEEVAIVRTVDRHAAIIVVLAVEDFVADARAILAEVTTAIRCEEMERPPADADDWLMREMEED